MLYKKQLSEMKKRLDELYDAQIRQRRMLTDILYNLDEENMPAIKQIIDRYKDENTESIASLEAKADENSARISMLAELQDEQSESIADIELQAKSNRSRISLLTSLQDEQGESIARIEQEVSEEKSSITLAVERSDSALATANEAKNAATNGASIILAVNADGSDARISADKILLEGVATFVRPDQLNGTEGVEQTVIDAGNIKTGKISAEFIDAEGLSVGDQLEGKWTMENDRLLFSGPATELAWMGFDGITYSANGATLLQIDRGALASAIRSRNFWLALTSQGISAGSGEQDEKLNIGFNGGSLFGKWYYGSSELATKADIEALRAEIDSGYVPDEPDEPDEPEPDVPEEPTERVATPQISPTTGVYMYDSITISCATPGATIYYTVSMESGESWSGTGSSPSVSVTAYTDGVDVMRITAYATKSGMLNSHTKIATIDVNAI